MLAVFFRQYFPKENSGLRIMIIFAGGIAIIKISLVSVQRHGRLLIGGVHKFIVKAIGIIIWRSFAVAVHAHHAVALIGGSHKRTFIHRDLFIVGAQAITVRIGIRQQAALQHFVGRIADAVHHVRGRKGALLHFGEIVFRHFV